MKRAVVCIVVAVFFQSACEAQNPNLYWRFANPYVYQDGSGHLLQFDVEISCTHEGTYHSSLQLFCHYDSLAFGSNVVANNRITYERLPLMLGQAFNTDKYTVANLTDFDAHTWSILSQATFLMASPQYMNSVPLYPVFGGYLQFTLVIADQNLTAGIDFFPESMDGGNYYIDVTHPVETKYGDPPLFAQLYANNLLNQVLIANSLELKAFLEGPFTGNHLNNNLNQDGYLPLQQPYHYPPWNYSGTENVAAIPNSDVVDWVLVELRETAGGPATATPATTIFRRAAFITKDGNIRALDGNSYVSFMNTINQNLYIVIWHRNHLAIMSADPVTGNNGLYSYDFSSSMNQVYGYSLGHKQLSPGIWGMVSADGDADGKVDNADKIDIWNLQSGLSGYRSGDFNLNGTVDNNDKNQHWRPNSGRQSQVPH
jgi:hypothetical protein